MPQIEKRWSVSFSLSAKNWAERKRAVPFSSCPVFGLVSALRLHSCRAVPSAQVPSVYHIPYLPFRKGDISTLQNRGHFYFALTGADPASSAPRAISANPSGVML
jgi:hypothetical protein